MHRSTMAIEEVVRVLYSWVGPDPATGKTEGTTPANVSAMQMGNSQRPIWLCTSCRVAEADSSQNTQFSLLRLVEHPQQVSCGAGRAALAFLTVADRLLRHVDAPCQIHLTESQLPPHPLGLTRHVLHGLGVFLLLPFDLRISRSVYYRGIEPPLGEGCRVVGIDPDPRGAHHQRPPIRWPKGPVRADSSVFCLRSAPSREPRLPSHSTVTDFAKFLGWSISQPRSMAQ